MDFEEMVTPIADSLKARGFLVGGIAVNSFWVCQPPAYGDALSLRPRALREAHANNRLAEYVETEIAIWLLTR